ncbi:MAG: DUF2513 domain-containing protein [Pseudomonadota bacterium]|nr:DUF2513 domain-containing protein [Pseudomonadota bacterium]
MKLELDLVRAILLMIADDPRREYPGRIAVEGTEQPLVDFHVELLNEGGLIKGCAVWDDADPEGGPIFTDNRLTFAGSQYLESIRDPEIWKTVKSVAKGAGATTLDAIVEIAKSVGVTAVRSYLGLPAS